MANEQQDSLDVPAIGRSRHLADDLLAEADIRINGDRPWDLQLHREEALDEIIARHSMGLGETYMRGDWDVQALDEFFYRLLAADLGRRIKNWRNAWRVLRSYFLNLQSRRRAFKIGEHHYNLGNEFYTTMLDNRLTYSCGYWPGANSLDDAQTAKLDLICRKLDLQPGMKMLDIGCGWGSLIGYAAQKYQVECVGVTVSSEQSAYVKERYPDLPVAVHLQDYRDLNESFDRIASVGMFEHVGRKNHRTFMEVAKRCLKKDGLMLLHTIGKIEPAPNNPWIDKYIFPNGEIPAAGQITLAAQGLLVCEDLHNFGPDYDKTLMAWHRNFEQNWPRFADRYGKHFYRMWRYYLLSCAGAFRAGKIQLWQWIFSNDRSWGVERIC
ncbi:cyclopropane fatty acyl phospholipid synthase [Microbulbifer sp. 2205BS26-8]|uniref:cyclopropane fatty acyl phospholipid synthase n=1 Tax=Microbulbifer sp. 2205BS26-8 TaxID=3064386 RepID=UPI00273F1ABA|nr:cyclopropane fatty acyl phospholipid synthase [Microbulbifer sp. 2205BS26-8]MDP5210847.1 cyclopropane fatty acyl phospholipid synthase [Microbulbifer sp. 2205BS26-8]